jgi:hypothetical protein
MSARRVKQGWFDLPPPIELAERAAEKSGELTP